MLIGQKIGAFWYNELVYRLFALILNKPLVVKSVITVHMYTWKTGDSLFLKISAGYMTII